MCVHIHIYKRVNDVLFIKNKFIACVSICLGLFALHRYKCTHVYKHISNIYIYVAEYRVKEVELYL